MEFKSRKTKVQVKTLQLKLSLKTLILPEKKTDIIFDLPDRQVSTIFYILAAIENPGYSGFGIVH